MDSVEYAETTTTTLEWTVRGLKHLFESSKGEAKSKVTKSIKFGNGRWQCLFYPNSGMDSGTYVSLYLSCEPTFEEKENAVNGKWVREGLFKFSFELRNLARNVLFNTKEACDHSFSYKTANWGWAQFARRDAVYFHPNTVKTPDAFIIICTITASPTSPTPVPTAPMKSVPKDLLDAVGNLLDDPVYSDVEFILPGRPSGTSTVKTRTIWAARRLLKRADYFKAMFESGFAEASPQGANRFTFSVGNTDEHSAARSSSSNAHRHFEDSDDEDENETNSDLVMDHDADIDFCDSNLVSHTGAEQQSHNPVAGNDDEKVVDADGERDDDDRSVATADSRNVRAKLSHPSSPRSCERGIDITDEARIEPKLETEEPGPRKVRVVVKDVAYTTYRAVLYYLYTDTIMFAPLSSSFHPSILPSAISISHSPPPSSSQTSLMLPPASSGEQSSTYYGNTTKELLGSLYSNKPPQEIREPVVQGPRTRRQWLKEWESNNPGRVLPCSSKAVYRLADKLDLTELKNRAFQHIVKSLTVTNVAYEVFSSFSATFEDVRKVQVEYFLAHWADIRGSDAMRNVWQQIRLGGHPGFEEGRAPRYLI
ncbi:hypothetical protein JB92DRAFT_3125987 [Gautieria morchelliformis]|nr:hypothetical protein JB92DRAFT_3125987 [Gautieria morchelliformis]